MWHYVIEYNLYSDVVLEKIFIKIIKVIVYLQCILLTSIIVNKFVIFRFIIKYKFIWNIKDTEKSL